jgi:DNA-binding SARP family transcriptional activator
MSGNRERVEVGILGPIEVIRPGGVRVELQLQCRKVLALLIAAPGRPVSTGQLARSIWGDDNTPSHAPQMVRSHIRILRRALQNETERILTTSAAGYRLNPAGCVVDADQFRRLLIEARQLLPRDAAGSTRAAVAALDLWRGTEAMPDVKDVQALGAEAAYLEELRCQAEETVVLSSLRSGHVELALPMARKLAELHPTRERFWLQLMVAETLSDRLVEATAVTFWRARRHLVEETGLYATGLDRLQRELLNGALSAEQLLNLITPRAHRVA